MKVSDAHASPIGVTAVTWGHFSPILGVYILP